MYSLMDVVDSRVLAGLTLASVVIYLVTSYYSNLRAVGNIKGVFTIFDPFRIPGAIFPFSRWNAGALVAWQGRQKIYQEHGDTVSVVSLIGGRPIILSSSMEVLKQVTAHRAPFDKNELARGGLILYGDNLASSYRDQWPRHRRIVNPAFNQQVYRQVWLESVKMFKDMTATEGWDMVSALTLPDVQPLVGKYALLVIVAVGFGLPVPWSDPPGSNDDNNMSLLEAFNLTISGVLVELACPRWMYYLPIKFLKRKAQARTKILSVMNEMIATRRAERANKTLSEKEDEAPNVFNLLLKANESESGKNVLDDSELIANVFVLLFAGHETSGKVMGCTLGLLACYPEEQDKAYQCIMDVLSDGRDPTFEDYDALQPVLGCLLEALRLCPPGSFVVRRPLETIVLQTETEGPPIVVSDKAMIMVDITGIGYNERYYPNPNAYIPGRWVGRDAEQVQYTFGAGARACLGRKFALLEMTCFLTLFLRDWAVEPVLRKGENAEGWRKRVLDDGVRIGITMGPEATGPLKLTRRK